MNATTDRIPLADAKHIAQRVAAHLVRYCDAMKIVGSVRRRTETCKDVELVCIPRTVAVESTDLFDEPTTTVRRSDGWHEAFRKFNVIRGNPANGKCITIDFEGVTVEVHCTTAKNWGYITTIFTGPKEFSERMVKRAKGLGFVCDDGALWRNTLHVPTPDEEAFFRHLGIPYQHPHQRI